MSFYSNFDQEPSLDGEFNSTSNEYPIGILLVDPNPQKIGNTWKNVMMMSTSHFSCISCFSWSGVHQKFVKWVLVGCGIEFPIQWVLPIKLLVKPHGVKLKIQVEKLIYFLFSSKIWWGKISSSIVRSSHLDGLDSIVDWQGLYLTCALKVRWALNRLIVLLHRQLRSHH